MLIEVSFFRHDTAPGAVLPLPPGEGAKNLPEKEDKMGKKVLWARAGDILPPVCHVALGGHCDALGLCF